MKTERMGKRITLTKEMYKKMGQKAEKKKISCKGWKILPYISDRIDPRSHVRFG